MLRRIKAIVAIFICICIIAGGITTISADSKDVFLYYNQLSISSKNIYNAFKTITPETTQISAEIEPITVSRSDSAGRQRAQYQIMEAMQAAIDAVFRDYPEIYWVKLGENGTSYGIYYSENSITGKITYEEVVIDIVIEDHYKNTINAENNELWENVRNFKVEGESRYDKVKSIHDALCENITYKETDFCYEAIGALNYNEAVCEGISEAFKIICDYNDIPCITVSGTGVTNGGAGGSGPHMWNYIQMEDGKWYAVDATWDLGRNHTVLYDYLLVGSQTVSQYYDDTFAQSHLDDGDFSGSGVMIFEYPPLSRQKYEEPLYPIEPTTTTQIPTTTKPVPTPTTASAPTTTVTTTNPTSTNSTTTNPTTTEPTTAKPTTVNPTATKPTTAKPIIVKPTTTKSNIISELTQPNLTQYIINNNIYDEVEVQDAKPDKVKGVKAKAGKKKVTVTWKKAKNAKKYVIKYSYKKNMKGAKTKTVKKLKVVLKKLKSKKKVYIQVQGVNGNTFGKWSKKISVKVK